MNQRSTTSLPETPVTPAQWRDFDASIERGLREISEGGGIPAQEAFETLYRKFRDLHPIKPR